MLGDAARRKPALAVYQRQEQCDMRYASASAPPNGSSHFIDNQRKFDVL